MCISAWCHSPFVVAVLEERAAPHAASVSQSTIMNSSVSIRQVRPSCWCSCAHSCRIRGQLISAEEPPGLLRLERGQPRIRALPRVSVSARLDPPRTANTVLKVQVLIPANLGDTGPARKPQPGRFRSAAVALRAGEVGEQRDDLRHPGGRRGETLAHLPPLLGQGTAGGR